MSLNLGGEDFFDRVPSAQPFFFHRATLRVKPVARTQLEAARHAKTFLQYSYPASEIVWNPNHMLLSITSSRAHGSTSLNEACQVTHLSSFGLAAVSLGKRESDSRDHLR
jgi:hypothetical protein